MGAHSCSTRRQWLTKEDLVRKTSICGGAELRGVSKVYNAKSFKCSRAPGYGGCNENLVGSDISILKLDEPVQFTNKIRPICLPVNPSWEQFENKTAVVAGWGYLNQSSISSLTPREADVRVLKHKTCRGQVYEDGVYKWKSYNYGGVTRTGWGYREYNQYLQMCTTGVKEAWHGPRAGDSGSALNLKENGRFSYNFSYTLSLFFRYLIMIVSYTLYYFFPHIRGSAF